MHLLLMQEREEIMRTHQDIAATINLLGDNLQKYRRERRTQAKAIVSDVYSAPRVTALIPAWPST